MCDVARSARESISRYYKRIKVQAIANKGIHKLECEKESRRGFHETQGSANRQQGGQDKWYREMPPTKFVQVICHEWLYDNPTHRGPAYLMRAIKLGDERKAVEREVYLTVVEGDLEIH